MARTEGSITRGRLDNEEGFRIYDLVVAQIIKEEIVHYIKEIMLDGDYSIPILSRYPTFVKHAICYFTTQYTNMSSQTIASLSKGITVSQVYMSRKYHTTKVHNLDNDDYRDAHFELKKRITDRVHSANMGFFSKALSECRNPKEWGSIA